MSIRSRTVLGILAAAVLALGIGWAVGQRGGGGNQPSASQESASAGEARLLADCGFVDLRGTQPPPLTVTDAAGHSLKLADFKGHLVILSFWGTGCVHCLHEMPILQKLEREIKGLKVVYVCADADDCRAAQATADRVAPGVRTFTVDGVGLARFDVGSLPTVWLIAPDGAAIGRGHGAKDWTAAAMRRLIEHWLPAS
jgi:thiol-disulfide isomerase/thioredoxin